MQVIPFTVAARRILARHPDRRAPAAMSALIPAWCASRAADGCSPSGVATYADKLRQFVAFARDKAPHQIDDRLIEAYKVDQHLRGLKCSTVRHSLTVVRAFCAWCVQNDYMVENVALAVKHPRVEPPPPDPLTRSQIDMLLAAIDMPPRSHCATYGRNRRAVLLMLYAGLRIAETAALRWADIDLSRRELIVRSGKGGKSRVIPICDELATELVRADSQRPDDAVIDQGDGRALKVKSLAHIFEKWLMRRGMDIYPHQLRKTFATELYVRGEDLTTIQRLLGHSDPKTTLRYIGASGAKERAAVQRLTFRAESKTADEYSSAVVGR